MIDMLRLRKFVGNEQGLIGMILIFGGLMLVGFMVMGYFMVDMLIKNIVPIGIVIILAMVLPVIVKGWYYGKTGQPYSAKEA